ncbi:MAG: FkbM family methyltransferase [Gemmatimonadaceae bacterium]
MTLAQRLLRVPFPYGTEIRVIRGPAKGMRFILEPGIGVSYALGTHAAAPRFFAKWLRPGATVYDVGSNKGQMALIFAALVGPSGRVLAFEPAPHEYESLARNIRINRLNNVRVFDAAAGERRGEFAFAYSREQPTAGKFVSVGERYVSKGADRFSVVAIPLDEVLAEEPAPDLIKIDVEGAAASVLAGARRIIEQGSPIIYVELHTAEEQAGIRNHLLDNGYIARTLSGDVVRDPDSSWSSPLWCSRPDASVEA